MANEKRLIDANALLDLLRPLEGVSVIIKKILAIIRNCPTVDAVEVVRCKECKHYELATLFDGRQKMRCENKKGIWTATQPDDFCSYGERKDNG